MIYLASFLKDFGSNSNDMYFLAPNFESYHSKFHVKWTKSSSLHTVCQKCITEENLKPCWIEQNVGRRNNKSQFQCCKITQILVEAYEIVEYISSHTFSKGKTLLEYKI